MVFQWMRSTEMHKKQSELGWHLKKGWPRVWAHSCVCAWDEWIIKCLNRSIPYQLRDYNITEANTHWFLWLRQSVCKIGSNIALILIHELHDTQRTQLRLKKFRLNQIRLRKMITTVPMHIRLTETYMDVPMPVLLCSRNGWVLANTDFCFELSTIA